MAGPSLGTFWGIGTRFMGSRDPRGDGSYVSTVWFCIFYIPLIPFESYRVRQGETSTLWIPGLFSHTSTSYSILGEEPTTARHIFRVYGVLMMIALLLTYMKSDKWLVPVDAQIEAEWTKVLTTFEPLKTGSIEGRDIHYSDPKQPKDSALAEKGRSLLVERATGYIPKWLPSPWDTTKAFEQWQLRARAGCAMVCQALKSCRAFHVQTALNSSTRPPYIHCSTYETIKNIRPGNNYHPSWDGPPMYSIRIGS